MADEPQKTPPSSKPKLGLTPKDEKKDLSIGSKDTSGSPAAGKAPSETPSSPAKASSTPSTEAPKPKPTIGSSSSTKPAAKPALKKPVTLAKPRPVAKPPAKQKKMPEPEAEEVATVSVPLVILDALAFAACIAFAILLYMQFDATALNIPLGQFDISFTHTE